MKRLRVLVLCHEELVPPDSIAGLSDEEISDYRAEFERLTPESYRPWLDNVAGNPMMSL